jgi:TonB family protein
MHEPEETTRQSSILWRWGVLVAASILAIMCPTAIAACIAIWSTPVYANSSPVEGKRKIVNMVTPAYPNIARTMRIAGTVKMEATVSRDGKAKIVDVKGGHPALIKSAVEAVHNWRWEKGSRETKESIEMIFDPNQP